MMRALRQTIIENRFTAKPKYFPNLSGLVLFILNPLLFNDYMQDES